VSTVREVTYQVLRDLGMRLIFATRFDELPFCGTCPRTSVRARVARTRCGGHGLDMPWQGKTVFVDLHSIATAATVFLRSKMRVPPRALVILRAGSPSLLAEPFLASRAVRRQALREVGL